MQPGNDNVIALLIDAENVSPGYIKVILDELSTYGTPAYKRIYGDWTSSDMSGWKKLLLENNLLPIQQFSYTQGKNASDSAMIIDAMDILYTKNCDGFCLVSSDSDFTRLASRLRESRMTVIGMGESKTPTAFKSACDIFKYLDVLMAAKLKESAKKSPRPEKAPIKPPRAKKPESSNVPAEKPAPEVPEAPGFVPLEQIVERIHTIIEHDSDDDGYMSLAQVGSLLGRLYPDFDTRNYGFSKLHKLIADTGAFDTRVDETPGGKNLLIKNK